MVVGVLIARDDNDVQLTPGRDAALEVVQGPGGIHAALFANGSVHADLIASVCCEDFEGPGSVHAPLCPSSVLAVLVVLR